MPIDKSQSAAGMLWRSSTCVQSETLPRSVAGVERHAVFEGWVQPGKLPDGVRLSMGAAARLDDDNVRQDYEVDGEGHLVRLGNQIDEELYPAYGLKYIDNAGERCTNYGMAEFTADTFGTVAKVERWGGFGSWADTPRNRELGLFKGEEPEKQCMVCNGAVDPNDNHQTCNPMFTGNLCAQCDGTWAASHGGNTDGIFGEMQAFLERHGFGPDKPPKQADLVAAYRGTMDPYWWQHKMCSPKKGWRDTEALDEPEKPKGPDGAVFKRTCDYCFGTGDVDESGLCEDCRQYIADHKPHTEHTAWIKAKLADGRVVESPMPSPKDGWVETWSERWQEGECATLAGSAANTVHCQDVWHPTGTTTDLQFFEGSPEALWVRDMRGPLVKRRSVGATTIQPSILEAKRFERKVEPEELPGYATAQSVEDRTVAELKSMQAHYGYGDGGWGQPKQEPSKYQQKLQEETAEDGQRQDAKALKAYPPGSWEE